jgi:hypothetical protein
VCVYVSETVCACDRRCGLCERGGVYACVCEREREGVRETLRKEGRKKQSEKETLFCFLCSSAKNCLRKRDKVKCVNNSS